MLNKVLFGTGKDSTPAQRVAEWCQRQGLNVAKQTHGFGWDISL